VLGPRIERCFLCTRPMRSIESFAEGQWSDFSLEDSFFVLLLGNVISPLYFCLNYSRFALLRSRQLLSLSPWFLLVSPVSFSFSDRGPDAGISVLIFWYGCLASAGTGFSPGVAFFWFVLSVW